MGVGWESRIVSRNCAHKGFYSRLLPKSVFFVAGLVLDEEDRVASGCLAKRLFRPVGSDWVVVYSKLIEVVCVQVSFDIFTGLGTEMKWNSHFLRIEFFILLLLCNWLSMGANGRPDARLGPVSCLNMFAFLGIFESLKVRIFHNIPQILAGPAWSGADDLVTVG